LNNTLLNDPRVIDDIRKEVEKFLDSKAVLRGELKAMITHIRRLERSRKNNQMKNLKLSQKLDQATPKSNR
jgi:uncharacterized protein (UPF0335 family)